MTARTLAAAVALALLAAAPATAAEAPCTTPASPDRHEPPCNPALAQSPWAASHRGSFAQASSPFPGPRPGQDVTIGHTTVRGVPIQIHFTEPYRDGGVAAWMSMVSTPDREAVVKLDAATGAVIDEHDALEDEGRVPTKFGSVSGAYSLLDRDGRLVVGRAGALEVFGDERPGEHRSPIRKLRSFALPASALCGPGDELVGITMLPSGHVAFATKHGVVGAVPRDPARMDAEHLRTLRLNAGGCAEGSSFEQVSNSIAADERRGIYVVTDRAQYRIDLRDGELRRTWRAEYRSGGGAGGARLGAGSGSTPTLMGTRRGDDRFVVITDGQDLMHLVLLWRGAIPRGWKGLPGRDRRIACEVPVTFGDPDATASISEQSVLVRGRAAVVVNNKLRLDAAFAGLPEQLRPFSVLSGQLPANAQPGVERIDWDPRRKRCRSRWSNPRLTIPNGIPTMSAATGLFYGVGLRDGQWGLQGIDFATGRDRLWVPAGVLPTENSFFAATEVGPGASVWTGTFLGVTRYVPR